MNNSNEPISKELKEWLNKRDAALQFQKTISETGGHVMLRSSAIDPDELTEPLRSEALKYLKAIE
jgi:hypothetical protein